MSNTPSLVRTSRCRPIFFLFSGCNYLNSCDPSFHRVTNFLQTSVLFLQTVHFPMYNLLTLPTAFVEFYSFTYFLFFVGNSYARSYIPLTFQRSSQCLLHRIWLCLFYLNFEFCTTKRINEFLFQKSQGLECCLMYYALQVLGKLF